MDKRTNQRNLSRGNACQFECFRPKEKMYREMNKRTNRRNCNLRIASSAQSADKQFRVYSLEEKNDFLKINLNYYLKIQALIQLLIIFLNHSLNMPQFLFNKIYKYLLTYPEFQKSYTISIYLTKFTLPPNYASLMIFRSSRMALAINFDSFMY